MDLHPFGNAFRLIFFPGEWLKGPAHLADQHLQQHILTNPDKSRHIPMNPATSPTNPGKSQQILTNPDESKQIPTKPEKCRQIPAKPDNTSRISSGQSCLFLVPGLSAKQYPRTAAGQSPPGILSIRGLFCFVLLFLFNKTYLLLLFILCIMYKKNYLLYFFICMYY